jgi:cell division protein FtsI (penicillin-binding protein 3)
MYILFGVYLFFKWKKNRVQNYFFVRVKVMRDIIIFLFLIFLTRLIQIQIIQRDTFREKQAKQVDRSYPLTGERGSIYDTSGKALAFNYNVYDLSLDPLLAVGKDNEKVLNVLKELVEKKYVSGSYSEIKKDVEQLGEERKRYRPLMKNLSEEQKRAIEKIQEKYGLSSKKKIFYFDTKIEREYYKEEIFKNVLGYIGFAPNSGSKKVGRAGIESQYEEYLKALTVEKTSALTGKKTLLPNSKDEFRLDLHGNNLYLTVDYELQYILNDEVKKQFDKTGSEEAYAVIMDPNSGKILATSFFTKNKKTQRNPIFQDQHEPGSIFKPIVVAAALNEGYINKNSKFDVGDGTIVRHKHRIKESSRSLRGVLTLEEALKKSSNVSMVLIGDKFTNLQMEQYLRKFGFYDRTGVDYPSEHKARNYSSKTWDGLKKSNIAFGQGINVTPIQMATAFSAVINGGILYRPYLVEKIVDSNGIVVRRNLPKGERVVDEKSSKLVKDMLGTVVESGTGAKAKVEGYKAGGKTGTAQISKPTGGYFKNEYLASFIGFFPLDKPKYTMLFMFYKPQGNSVNEKYGGTVAAPPFGEVVRRIVKSKNIPSANVASLVPQEYQHKRNNKVPEEKKFEQMPDLKGFSAREVSSFFKSRYYKLEIIGTGKVYNQEPKAGTNLEDIRKIKVYLK